VLPLLVCAVLSSVPAAIEQMIVDREVAHDLAQLVVLASGMKSCEGEHAAFVVKRTDGKLAVIKWSTDCAALRKSYHGIVPPNTIAIVHTHPEGRREPSMQDIGEARRIKLPICVLTRRGIWMADPVEGKSIALLDDPAWTSH
jgi:JAB domain-containing protein similar to deubiquitination enzymes